MLNAFYGPLFFKRQSVTKTLRIMKLTAIILLSCSMQLSAEANSQGITLNVRNAPLNKVFQEIKKQTGYIIRVDIADATVIYGSVQYNQRVSVCS